MATRYRIGPPPFTAGLLPKADIKAARSAFPAVTSAMPPAPGHPWTCLESSRLTQLRHSMITQIFGFLEEREAGI
jgi:hypothetical protein